MAESLTSSIMGRQARFQLKPTAVKRPQRVIVYGPAGAGKTTFASRWPHAVLVDAEHGADELDMMTIGTPGSGFEVCDMCQWVADYGRDEGVETLVIDSLDAVEPLIWADVCREGARPSIDAFEFGKGYAMARERWSFIRSALDRVIIAGINVVCIGHAISEVVHDPTGTDYTRYTIALHAKSAQDMIRWADSVLFLDLDREVKDVDRAKKVGKAFGSGRIIYTANRPGALAKSRRVLPSEIDVGEDRDFTAFFQAWNGGMEA